MFAEAAVVCGLAVTGSRSSSNGKSQCKPFNYKLGLFVQWMVKNAKLLIQTVQVTGVH